MRISFDENGANYSLLSSLVAPRPIGLISTVDRDGNPNLAPFSFFNLVSIDPPVLIFSPVRRMRNNTEKHTIQNLREVPEAVIHIVSYDLIHQMNLAACEYDDCVDEFIKAGFTKERASVVRPAMIEACPVKFECRITEVKPLGNNGGAGTLCIAKVLCVHVDEKIFSFDGRVDPLKLGQVARLGEDWYCRMTKESLFTLPKPNKTGIGFDGLPEHILKSKVFNKNQLAQLGAVAMMPELNENFKHIGVKFLMEEDVSEERTRDLHLIAARMLDLSLVEEAWQVLLRADGIYSA
ncbi:MAG: flavin reductase family protein [Bacteroidota bacterium]